MDISWRYTESKRKALTLLRVWNRFSFNMAFWILPMDGLSTMNGEPLDSWPQTVDMMSGLEIAEATNTQEPMWDTTLIKTKSSGISPSNIWLTTTYQLFSVTFTRSQSKKYITLATVKELSKCLSLCQNTMQLSSNIWINTLLLGLWLMLRIRSQIWLICLIIAQFCNGSNSEE